MRRTYLGLSAAVLSLAMARDASEFVRLAPVHGSGRRPYYTRMVGVPANINRHTGKPHEHKREIARRQRQLARLQVEAMRKEERL